MKTVTLSTRILSRVRELLDRESGLISVGRIVSAAIWLYAHAPERDKRRAQEAIRQMYQSDEL